MTRGPQLHLHASNVAYLRVREVRHGRIPLAYTGVLAVLRYTDDRVLRTVFSINAYVVAQCLTPGHITIGERAIDNRDFHGLCGIGLSKIAALQDRRPHDMKEIWADRVPSHQAIHPLFAALHAVQKRNGVVASSRTRPDLHESRGFDSGQNAQPVHERVIEADNFRIRVETLR